VSASATAQAEATARIVSSALALLGTLDDAGRTKGQFPFDGPQKTRWSNFPSPFFQREGLRMGDLTPSQRAAANALLSVALSKDGYRKVTEIVRADEVLRQTDTGPGPGPGGPGGGPGDGGPGGGQGPGGPGGGPGAGRPGLIYVPNGGEGNVTVVHQDSADTYSVVATVQTFQGAKTIALDPVTHNAYQFQPERGPAAASTANTATPVAGPGGYGRGPQGPIIAAWFIVIRGQ
jgi:hypothetical protein